MAGLCKEDARGKEYAKLKRKPQNYKVILTVGSKRHTVRLGIMRKRSEAEAIRSHLEDLEKAAKYAHGVSPDTEDWLEQQSPHYVEKLRQIGLPVVRLEKTSPLYKLGQAIDWYLEDKTFKSEGTAANCRAAFKRLTATYGRDRYLSSLHVEEAKQFFAKLTAPDGFGLALSTAQTTMAYARALYRRLQQEEIVQKNIFAAVDVGGTVVGEKAHISRELASRVMDILPNDESRLLFAFARWGGVRMPSEAQDRTWLDVEWDANRIAVYRRKQRTGGWFPIFAELREPLRAVYESRRDDDSRIFRQYGSYSSKSFGQILKHPLKKAGIKPWPGLWKSLRATRITELEEHPDVPEAAIKSWIGNSQGVRETSYYKPSPELIEKLAGG